MTRPLPWPLLLAALRANYARLDRLLASLASLRKGDER